MVPECTKVFMNVKALYKIIYFIHKRADKISHCSISPGSIPGIVIYNFAEEDKGEIKIRIKSIKA